MLDSFHYFNLSLLIYIKEVLLVAFVSWDVAATEDSLYSRSAAEQGSRKRSPPSLPAVGALRSFMKIMLVKSRLKYKKVKLQIQNELF